LAALKQRHEHEYILYFKPGVPIAVIEAKNNCL
jgi:type I site-specific restriction endonuclease